MRKNWATLVLFILMFTIFTACVHENDDNKVDPTTPSTPVNVSKIPTQPPTSTPILKSNAPSITNESLKELSDFKALKDCFLPVTYSNLSNKYKDTYFEAFIQEDLNMDGKKDDIHLALSRDKDSYIEVNQAKLTTFIDPSSLNCDKKLLHLVDLDKSDRYKDIACLSQGGGGVCKYQLYRYDGTKLYYLGETLSDTIINESGKLIPMTYYSYQFKPLFCSAWYEIKDNTLELHKNDTKKFMNQSYAYKNWEIPTFFMPCETLPNTTQNLTGSEYSLASCQLKILDILYDSNSRELNYYFVQLPTGEKGILYFNFWP